MKGRENGTMFVSPPRALMNSECYFVFNPLHNHSLLGLRTSATAYLTNALTTPKDQVVFRDQVVGVQQQLPHHHAALNTASLRYCHVVYGRDRGDI